MYVYLSIRKDIALKEGDVLLHMKHVVRDYKLPYYHILRLDSNKNPVWSTAINEDSLNILKSELDKYKISYNELRNKPISLNSKINRLKLFIKTLTKTLINKEDINKVNIYEHDYIGLKKDFIYSTFSKTGFTNIDISFNSKQKYQLELNTVVNKKKYRKVLTLKKIEDTEDTVFKLIAYKHLINNMESPDKKDIDFSVLLDYIKESNKIKSIYNDKE